MGREVPFADALAARVQKLGTRLVVGLDPVLDRFPQPLRGLPIEDALAQFCDGVLQAVASHAAAVKPQIAFFEQFGWRGFRAFQGCVERASALGIPVIADCKRGDIGSTATAYAEAFLGDNPDTPGPFVDALTVNPYLGGDSLQPFLQRAVAGHRGLFVLARTSNPGARDLQDRVTDGDPLYLGVARAVAELGKEHVSESGYGPLGLVSGATYPEELEQIRAAAPQSWLLIPGLGAQGGQPEDLRAGFDSAGMGALPSSSRAILYAYQGETNRDWAECVNAAARETQAAIEAALPTS